MYTCTHLTYTPADTSHTHTCIAVEPALALSGVLHLLNGILCSILHRHTVELALSLSAVMRLLSGMLCTTQTHSRTGISTECCDAFAEWYVVYHTDTQ